MADTLTLALFRALFVGRDRETLFDQMVQAWTNERMRLLGYVRLWGFSNSRMFLSLEDAKMFLKENPSIGVTWIYYSDYRLDSLGNPKVFREGGVCIDPECTCDGSMVYWED